MPCSLFDGGCRLRRLQATVDPQNNRTTYVYDDAGQQIAIVDALGNRTTQEYYDTGRLKAIVSPLGNRTTFSYDSLGNRTVVEDALNRRTTSAYQCCGMLQSTLDARGYRTTFSYDALRRRTAVQDARGNYTTFVYDAASQLTAQVDQLAQRTTYGYDDAGRQQWRLDAKGERTTHVYDDAGRQTRIEYSDGGRVSFTYDAARNRTKMEDSTGVTTSTYDELSRLKTITYPANKGLTYTYDAAGNRATLVDADGGTTTYSFDSRNALSWLLNPFAERTTWVYDVLGRVTTMTHANGALAQHDYDAAGRLTALRNLKSDLSVISVFTHSYDNAGNRTGVEEASGDLVTWSYDETYQLTREQRSGANAYDTTFTYDGVGNRATKVEGGVTTTYVYDAANELTTSEDNTGVTTFTYDANGNTASKLEPNGDRTTYSYDIENMLTQVALPDASTSTFAYDGNRRLRSKTEGGSLTNFLRDVERVLVEADSGWSTQARYTGRGGGWYDPLVAMRRSGASSFYHFDALGSADHLSDVNEGVTDSYLYKAFGVDTVLSGSTTNPYRFVGALGYYKTGASLLHLGARYYMPGTGRFLQRDRASTHHAEYGYAVRLSPTSVVDPSGLFAWVALIPYAVAALAGCGVAAGITWLLSGTTNENERQRRCEAKWNCLFGAITGLLAMWNPTAGVCAGAIVFGGGSLWAKQHCRCPYGISSPSDITCDIAESAVEAVVGCVGGLWFRGLELLGLTIFEEFEGKLLSWVWGDVVSPALGQLTGNFCGFVAPEW